MVNKNEDVLRQELVRLLNPGGAHVSFDEAIVNIPKEYYGMEVEGIPYTLWRILQHMYISQHDILDYITNPEYVELVWPDDYWPQEKVPPNAVAWKKCVKQCQSDLKELIKLVKNPKTKILEPIPHMRGGPTILREILLVADHNSYHIGQIILLRGLLGIWED